MNAHRPASGQPEPWGSLFSQNNFEPEQVFTATTFDHSDEVSGETVKIFDKVVSGLDKYRLHQLSVIQMR